MITRKYEERGEFVDFSEVRVVLKKKSESLDGKLNSFREDRDEWNNRVQKYLTERNEINRQVKELISEVQKQKLVRDEANSNVRELKVQRNEYSVKLKALRETLKENKPDVEVNHSKKDRKRTERQVRMDMNRIEDSHMMGRMTDDQFSSKRMILIQELKEIKLNKSQNEFESLESDIRDAARLQEDSHRTVEKAVHTAQEAHDLMIELSEEVDRLRDKANRSQEGVIRSKREADTLHGRYIVSLRSIHSIQDLFKAMSLRERESDEDGTDKLEINDLMSRLMSGDTLSTEELLALQRN